MNPDEILKKLGDAGFEAYYVGGCVRDRLMNKPAHDVDIATNALPEEIMRVFCRYTVIPTGLRHGTVTVAAHGDSYEITTFRVDGSYSDSRRPDSVTFTNHIETDLARRDFTMNAIAMDVNGKIIDPFGGADDIKNKIIRCVGEPTKRFCEDALRIMRAVRFTAQLGFGIEKNTADAVHEMCGTLNRISHERIRNELDRLICGEGCVDVMLNFSDVIAAVIPEFSQCIGFEQHSDYHCYDVWEHTVRAMASAPTDNLRLRRSLLFHDVAKPLCAKFDSMGKGHFKGHAEKSAEMALKIMKRLRYDSASAGEAALLIRHHSDKIRTKAHVKRLLNELGEALFLELIEMKKCDNLAKRNFVLKENEEFDEFAEMAREICRSGECYSCGQLAVNGNDLLELGLCGNKIGKMLEKLLNAVIDDKLNNDREALINYVKRRLNL